VAAVVRDVSGAGDGRRTELLAAGLMQNRADDTAERHQALDLAIGELPLVLDGAPQLRGEAGVARERARIATSLQLAQDFVADLVRHMVHVDQHAVVDEIFDQVAAQAAEQA
jgi:hypothetical protein